MNLDNTYSKIFTPNFNKTIKTQKLRPVFHSKPIQIEEIKSIIENSLNKSYAIVSNLKQSHHSTRNKSSQLEKPISMISKVKNTHLFPSFMKTHTNVPFVFKGLKSHTLSPLLRIHKKKFLSSKQKDSKTIETRVDEPYFEVSAFIEKDFCRSSCSSSSSEINDLYKTRYN